MSLIQFFSEPLVRLGLLPLASVLVTGFVRVRATKSRRPFSFRSPATYAVGLDLMVAALFVLAGVLIERFSTLHTLIAAQPTSAPDSSEAVSLRHRITELNDRQMTLALLFAGVSVATYALVDYVHAFGYIKDKSVYPSLSWFRGVIIPFFVGLSTLLIVLIMSA